MAWWLCKVDGCDAGDLHAANGAAARHAMRRHYLNEHYYPSLQPPITARERNESFERQLRLTTAGRRVVAGAAVLIGAATGFLSGVAGYGVPA